MVTARDSQTRQQFSAWNSPDFDRMALVHPEQNYNSLSCFPPKFTANTAIPGQYPSDLHLSAVGPQDAIGGFLKIPPRHLDISYPIGNHNFKDSECATPRGLGAIDKSIDAPSASQKRFLIFDQSGNQTRLFFNPFSPCNQIIASKNPPSANGPYGEVRAQVDQQFMMKPIIEEKWDENHLTDGEDEMLEDTEEIDALLDSDSDDDDDDDDEYEVTSTGHTPFGIEEGKLLDDLKEEVASCDGSSKRQRLLDGSYKKSSLVSGESPVKRAISCNHEDDAEYSSCGGDRISCHDDIDSSKRAKKVKIHQALRILKSIIPELNTDDPLCVIDKAIAYLKSMKTEAEAHGLGYPEPKSLY